MTSEPFDTSTSIAPPATTPPAASAASPEKSAAVAFVLTLVLPGLGHWYAGEKGRAAAFAGTTVTAILLSLAHPALGLIATIAFLWALLDARHAVARQRTR